MHNPPLSTYRVQLHAGFTFRQLHEQLDYLHTLGIDWIYASPVLMADPGSVHGYDQADVTRLNPELGTQAEWDALHAERKRLGMGWLQDIVPNHMAYSLHNPWIREVLRHGEASTVAKHFDIDWRHPDFQGRIMLPILGDDLEVAIERGDVRIADDGAGVQVYDKILPLSSRSLGRFPELISAPLDQILAAQHYALCNWRESSEHINFRRFFTVNSLICLRAERPETFVATHEYLLSLLKKGDIDGLRLDHIDGLLDPTGYLKRLREACSEDTFILVEKILEHGERIPEQWPIQGSSGYDFMASVNQLLRQPSSHTQLEAVAKTYVSDIEGFERPVAKKIFDNKLYFLHSRMAGELDNLVHHALGALAGLPLAADRELLKGTLGEWLAGFPVYRAYVRFGSFGESDRKLLVQAVDRAIGFGAQHVEGLEKLRSWLRSITRLDDKSAHFLQRGMQLSGPLMAKGIEDTTFYQHANYLAANEVGDNPAIEYCLSIDEFHDQMVERQLSEMNASSTHDTKRGEDARARLHAISAFPGEWSAFAKTAYKAVGEELRLPGDIFLMLLQSFLGAWPSHGYTPERGYQDFVDRMAGFAEKAIREGKRHGSWAEPNEALEKQCRKAVERWLNDDIFRKALGEFDSKIKPQAYLNALRGLVLKCTCPGLPDVYQGAEYGDYSLVDPDNRRLVDYPARRLSLLGEQKISDAPFALPADNRDFDVWKQLLLRQLLHLRKADPRFWQEAQYLPIDVKEGRGSILAYRRVFGDDSTLIVVAVRSSALNVWPVGDYFGGASIELAQLGRVKELFSGKRMELAGRQLIADLLAEGPVAVFVAET